MTAIPLPLNVHACFFNGTKETKRKLKVRLSPCLLLVHASPEWLRSRELSQIIWHTHTHTHFTWRFTLTLAMWWDVLVIEIHGENASVLRWKLKKGNTSQNATNQRKYIWKIQPITVSGRVYEHLQSTKHQLSEKVKKVVSFSASPSLSGTIEKAWKTENPAIWCAFYFSFIKRKNYL